MRVTDDNIYMKVPGMKIRDFINSASWLPYMTSKDCH
jgi:hypothetical protein